MITFYAPNDAHGHYSNFSQHPVDIYDRVWRTSEHPFQAMKFHPHRPDLVAAVHKADRPRKAAELGRNRSFPMRTDWDSAPGLNAYGDMPLDRIPSPTQPDDTVYRGGLQAEPLFARTKDVFMYEVCLAKFSQHADLKGHLLATGDQPLVEDALHDPYWGWGASRNGQNKLGRILMAVREVLRRG